MNDQEVILPVNSPTIYTSLKWWKDNIGFTNPNWNIIFYRIYINWACDLLQNNKNLNLDSISDFLNDSHMVVQNYYFDYDFEEKWSMEIAFKLTCFYFIHTYHYLFFTKDKT